jgi:PAS domain S-box-containing protein
MLTGQMAIAVDNARLYSQLGDLLKARTEALSSAEEQIRTLFESAQVGIALTTLEGEILSVNKALLRITGYTETELLQQNIVGLYVDPEQRAQLQEQLDESGTVHNFGIRAFRKDGSFFYASLNASKLSQSEQDIYLAMIDDVSERIQAQEALQESQERFRVAFDSANIGQCMVDLQGNLLRVNDAMCSIFGYSKEELESMTVNDIAHPDDQDLSPRFIERATSGEITRSEFEKRYFHKEGHIVWGRVTSALVREADGTPKHFISHVQDITERLLLEHALQERVKELNCLYGISQLMIKPGISLDEIFQGTVELIPPAWQYPEITNARILLEDQEFKSEGFEESTWQLRSDINLQGKPVGWVEVYYKEERPEIDEGPFLKEERNLLNAICERLGRIVQRMRAEEALQKSTSELTNIIETAMDAILTVNEDQLLVMINPAAERLFGFEGKDVVGKPLNELMPARFRKKHTDHIRTFGQTNTTNRNMGNMGTLWGRRANGEEFPIEASISQVNVSGEKLYTAIIRDITERKLGESQLQELATLEERNRIARELHDSVTQSLYSINLQSDATILALSSGRVEDAEKRLQMLKDIAQESMSEMRLLIYEMHPSILEEAGLAAALRQRLETVESRSGIEVDLQVEGDRRLPIAVEEELFHISLEGLNNVLKHAKAKQVLVGLSFEHDRCRLMIQDDGVGFALASSDRFGGYGLVNIKDRLEKIGGELSIITEPGKGTILDIEVAI